MTLWDYHREIAGKISKILDKKIYEIFKTKKEAGYQFSQMGFNGKNKIQRYTDGYTLAYDISSARKHISPRNLECLALFYHFLGIPEDDEIVRLTRNINTDFRYPPAIEKDITCAISVSFSETDNYLTENQKKHLENLALLYARGNRNNSQK